MPGYDDWSEEALCSGMDVEKFFDKYEEDSDIAKQTDRVCAACPIVAECFKRGISSESWGVWGGIYLVDGKVDKSKNSHKNKKDWERIYQVISDVH